MSHVCTLAERGNRGKGEIARTPMDGPVWAKGMAQPHPLSGREVSLDWGFESARGSREGQRQGSLHCATDDGAVRRCGSEMTYLSTCVIATCGIAAYVIATCVMEKGYLTRCFQASQVNMPATASVMRPERLPKTRTRGWVRRSLATISS